MVEEIDLPWDSHLLGSKTSMLMIDESSNIHEVEAALKESDSINVIAKMPTGRGELQNLLANRGFSFREIQFTLRSPELRLPIGAPSRRFRIKNAGKLDTQNVLAWISAGLFKLDRYSLDPDIGPKLSGKRYCGLLLNELEKGAVLKILDLDSSPVAFYLIREVGKRPYVALSGVNPEVRIPLVGRQLHASILEDVIGNFTLPLEAVVSSSNIAALRIHFQVGYQIVRAHEVFVLLRKERV